MKTLLKTNSRSILQPKVLDFLGQMEIIEVEVIGFCEVGFEITVTYKSMIEVNTCNKIHQMLVTMFSPYGVS